jgi:glucosylceramidase
MAFMVNGIQILNNHSRSYILWNMALDEENGPVVPGFGRSTCRGIVTVNQQTGELTYNLDYYALAHFSKFIRPGAVRVFAESKGQVYVTAALNTDGTLVIVAANDDRGAKPVRFTVRGESFVLNLPGKAAATVVVKKPPQARQGLGLCKIHTYGVFNGGALLGRRASIPYPNNTLRG